MASLPFSLLLLLMSAFVASSLAIHAVPTTNASYVVVTSDVLLPGSELLIDLHLLDLVRSDPKEGNKEPDECVIYLSVSADVHLWHRSVWKIELDKTPRSFFKTLKILVSDEKSLGSNTTLKIESSSCFKFSRSVDIPIGSKELSLSLRTDKLKYSPGELVLIESLVLTHDLRPHVQPVNLSIYNSKNDLLVKWLSIISNKGLIREEYNIPLDAQSDSLVLYLESDNQVVNHSVQIKQSGPLGHQSFLVEVRAPRVHVLHSGDERKSQSLAISVVASHQSGDPLEGKVKLHISLSNSTKSGSLPPVELENGLKVFALKPEDIKKVLGLKIEESLAGREVKVQADIEEQLSELGEALVTFLDQSHTLSFGQFTPQFFKPGLSYIGQIMLRHVDPFCQIRSEEQVVTLKVSHYNNSSTENPRVTEYVLKLTNETFSEFSIMVPKDDVKLELEATFEDQITGKTAKAHLREVLPFSTSKSIGHYVQVFMDKKPPRIYVGETFKVKVELTFPITDIIYQVSCQSVLVHSDKFVAPFPATKHDFTLMLPYKISNFLSSCHFIVEVFTPSKEILSDGFQFVVEQKQEVPLELQIKTDSVEKGKTFEINVKAEPFTVVYLISAKSLLASDPEEQEIRKFIARGRMMTFLKSLKIPPGYTHEVGQGVPAMPSLAPDSQRVLNESRSLLLTDGLVFIDQTKKWPTPSSRKAQLDNFQRSNFAAFEEFDSNLWNVNITVGSTGKETLHLLLPEEARLYTLAAFGLRPGVGLVVVNEPVQITKDPIFKHSSKPAESMDQGSIVANLVTDTIDAEEVIHDPNVQDDHKLGEDEDFNENFLGVGVVDYWPDWQTSPTSVSALPKGVSMKVRCEDREETLQIQRRTHNLIPFATSHSLRGQDLLWNHDEEERMGFYKGDKVKKGVIVIKKLNEFQEKLYLLEFQCGDKVNIIEPWSEYLNTAPRTKKEDVMLQLVHFVRINQVLHLQYRETGREYIPSTPSTTPSTTQTICNCTCKQKEPGIEEEVYKWINLAGNLACFIIFILLAWIVFNK